MMTMVNIGQHWSHIVTDILLSYCQKTNL